MHILTISIYASMALAILSGCLLGNTPTSDPISNEESGTQSPIGEQPKEISPVETDTFILNMKSGRQGHTATTLSDGRILVTGGTDEFGTSPLGEIFNPTDNTWTPIRAMRHARTFHTATLLNDGKILVAGGEDSAGRMRRVEIYDPNTNSWVDGPDLLTLRGGHSATRLNDGQILLVGGRGASPVNTAEIYNPQDNTWNATGSTVKAHAFHTATLFQDGRVLVVGGDPLSDDPGLTEAEIYNPGTGQWSSAGDLEIGRAFHTATLLKDGRVLITGGSKEQPEAEIYYPDTNKWKTIGQMEIRRLEHTASLLPDGRVLVVGGRDPEDYPNGTAEIFNPSTGTFSPAGDLDLVRQKHSASNLNDGRVIIVGGGGDDGVLKGIEIFDPTQSRWLVDDVKGLWRSGTELNQSRTSHTATLLSDGRVLVVGGRTKQVKEGQDGKTGTSLFLTSAEIHDPNSGNWDLTASLSHVRSDHFAIRLLDGRVLVSGGQFLGKAVTEEKPSIKILDSAEIYDPATGQWSPTGKMTSPRQRHAGIVLSDGRILVVGGDNSGKALESTEIYDPSTGQWKTAPPMANQRSFPELLLLQDGRVMAMGGAGGSAELFDPSTQSWENTGGHPGWYSGCYWNWDYFLCFPDGK